jgi:hypothetical protein
MTARYRFLVLYGMLLSVGLAQSVSPSSGQLEAMEKFAKSPTARVLWSAEAGRIESDQGQATITALILEDPSRGSRFIRGISISLEESGSKDQVYTSEDLLHRLTGALDEISRGLPFFVSRPRGPNACFGSGVFWNQAQAHTFRASYCFFGAWSGLSVNTGAGSFRFSAVEPAAFAAAIDRAKKLLGEQLPGR